MAACVGINDVGSQGNTLSDSVDIESSSSSPLFVYLHAVPLVEDTVMVNDFGSEVTVQTPVEELDYKGEQNMLLSVIRDACRNIRFKSEVAMAHSFISNVTACKVLHFTGHGVQGGLAVENEAGIMNIISGSMMNNLLAKEGSMPPVVFISACYSESIAGAVFVDAGAPHVVAISRESKVLDRKAKDFTHTFYTLLLRGDSVRQAFDGATARLHMTKEKLTSDSKEGYKFKLLPEDADHDERPFAFVPPGHFEDITCPPAPSNCWPVAQYFLGRNVEVVSVVKYLRMGTRCVCIVGLPGIGKTQIALRACGYASDRHMMSRTIFVSLKGERSTEAVASAFAEALDIDTNTLLQNGGNRVKEGLLNAIRAKCTTTSEPELDSFLLLLSGCRPWLILNEAPEKEYKLVEFIGALLQKVPRLRILMTSSTAPKMKGVKSVTVNRLEPSSAAELFVRLAPRELKISELNGGVVDILDDPINVFSRGEIMSSLGGHPGAITIAASRVVEGYSLLKDEYDMLHSVIPTIKRQFQQFEDEHLSEVRSALSARNSQHVNGVSELTRLRAKRNDSFQGYAPLEVFGREPSLPHFLPGTPYAHSPSSKRQYPDTILKELRDEGKKIWQYAASDDTSVGVQGGCREGGGRATLILWGKLYDKGLKIFLNFHVGKGRTLSDGDILYLGTDERMWHPSKPPVQNGGWVPMKGFLDTFWPWFQAFVAMIVSNQTLWHSLAPRFICGFSTKQAEMALRGTEEGTFVIKVSASQHATVVFCIKRKDCVQQVRARKRREGGFVVDFKGKGVVNTFYNHVMGISSLKQLAPAMPKAFAFKTLCPEVKKMK